MADAPYIGDLLENSPKNWGKWGPDDEVGALNYLGVNEVIAAAQLVRSGNGAPLTMSLSDMPAYLGFFLKSAHALRESIKAPQRARWERSRSFLEWWLVLKISGTRWARRWSRCR